MSDFEKQLERHARSTKLSAAEKRELKARVVSYMEYHPRRETVAAKKAQAYIESQPYTLISIHNRIFQATIGTMAIFVLVVIPAVAERAVPGDVLYPIKVSINEEVRSTLTFDATEKIEWETERLERRIAEVRLLAEEGKLTEETEQRAVMAVKAHAEAAQGEINKLKESDVDAATLAEVEFESALQVQSAVLDAGQKISSTTAEATNGISEAVKEAQATVEATKGVAIPAFDRIAARLERQTTRAYELMSSLETVASPEEQAEIQRRLQDIERKIETGVALHETEKVVPDILLEALADTQKLISFMTDIDVRATVELEALVPMQLTKEEKVTFIEEALASASSTIAAVTSAVEGGTLDPDAAEKLTFGVAGMEEMVEDLIAPETADSTELTEAQVDGQFRQATELSILTADVDLLLRNNLELIKEPVSAENETSADDPATTTADAVIDTESGTTTDQAVGTETEAPATTTDETTTADADDSNAQTGSGE